MTNEELLSVAEIVEKLTDRFNAQAALHRERFDEHVKLIASMKADHETKMVEHRAAFGARTEADAKIIAGLRVQVQDMRAEMERLRAQMSEQEVSVVGIINERNETWERFWAEVARLKSQTPKQHPVKVGEWVKASNGAVSQVLEVHKDWYLIARGHGWTFANCEPYDPPATHDTEQGKAAAESGLLLNGGLDVRKVTP